MKIGNDGSYDKFVRSTVDLDADEAVSSRKIDLEFKNIISPPKQYQHMDLEPSEIKEADIYHQFTSTKHTINPIGKANYSIINNYTAANDSETYIKKKIEKGYQTGNAVFTGRFVNCAC